MVGKSQAHSDLNILRRIKVLIAPVVRIIKKIRRNKTIRRARRKKS
jgi:hypothetical protein